MHKISKVMTLGIAMSISSGYSVAAINQTKGSFEDKFRQLDEVLPTANDYRTASGAPGHAYWQQQVDYDIDVTLHEDKRRISASATITYHNNSPDTLKYLWLQLDQNIYKEDSIARRTETFNVSSDMENASTFKGGKITLGQLRKQQFMDDNELGYAITKLTYKGKPLDNALVGTNMRIDLAKPLKSGEKVEFDIHWAYNMVDQKAAGGRSGYEHFPKDEVEGGNDIFQLAQWFPRLHSYTDYEGWTNKAFLGRGEFTIEFGNYNVDITVPSDHIVSATGELTNAKKVLNKQQLARLEKSKRAKQPIFIVTEEEALAAEKQKATGQKTWSFAAKNVRDFAWASSRKFMWDAQGYQQGGKEQPLVMAMSFYPKEGGDLWKKYSTASVIHTMQVYSRYTFDYPYPTAQSVNGPVGGMEYPMITFNGPRTKLQKDGSRTYPMSEKSFLIGVVIHEVGHIYFPMIVNSDERQWTWMDEGINSFLEGVAEREWDANFPWKLESRDIVEYMKSSVQVPIMTQSDSVLKFGPNAYTKPAVALNILREVILGRELFDFAFKEYALRWKYKRPTPADLFRTLEEASGVDLDWFWRGWFYSTDHVDISIDNVYKLEIQGENPDINLNDERDFNHSKPLSMSIKRNKEEGLKTWVELNPTVRDFYDENDQYTVTNKERNAHQSFLKGLKPWEKRAYERALEENKHYYAVQFSNIGGLVMPILLDIHYEDGTMESLNIPAEIWRRSPKQVSKLLVLDKPISRLEVDASWQTADVDIRNNHFPRKMVESRLQMYKYKRPASNMRRDIMNDIKTELKKDSDNDKQK